MSDTVNPYQSPEASAQAIEPIVSQGGLTESMLKSLGGASPWLRFMGIMGFIGSGFMVLGGISSLAVMPLMSDSLSELGGMFDGLSSFAPFIAVYAVYFMGAGVLMFFPALFTYRFGDKIRNYIRTNSLTELEQAFQNNKSLWKFNGILMIVALAIFPVIIIISIIVGIVMVLR
ncbi:MAG: hypothetical protein LBH43_18575 [Treponema sp.]|jgi:uncharacterized membrane protein|nr:hypothetical protein [Treponema sp.]